jgi:sensor domain CHASE-containing protein
MSAPQGDMPVPQAAIADRFRQHKWILVATFFGAYLFAVLIAIYANAQHAETRRIEARMLAQGYAQRLQERLQAGLVSTHILASLIKQSGGRLANFDDVAAELLVLFPSVSALAIAPDGVITEMFPLHGNEGAIGHDLLADRKRNREAAVAITTRQLTLAGPFNLIQGGVGTVGRLPVFLLNARNEYQFWGFVSALMRIPTLIDSAGLNDLTNAGYRYELWRIHPDTEERHVFASGGGGAPEEPEEYVVTIFNSRWILSIAPDGGWVSMTDYARILGFAAIAASLITLLQFLGLRWLHRLGA